MFVVQYHMDLVQLHFEYNLEHLGYVGIVSDYIVIQENNYEVHLRAELNKYSETS